MRIWVWMVYIVGFDMNEQSRRAWYAADTGRGKRHTGTRSLTVQLALKPTARQILWVFQADPRLLRLLCDFSIGVAKDLRL
jgi:hypothetical protein